VLIVNGVSCQESSIDGPDKLLIDPEGSEKKACSSTSSFSPLIYLFLLPKNKENHIHFQIRIEGTSKLPDFAFIEFFLRQTCNLCWSGSCKKQTPTCRGCCCLEVANQSQKALKKKWDDK
jgi:hypothetical protein